MMSQPLALLAVIGIRCHQACPYAAIAGRDYLFIGEVLVSWFGVFMLKRCGSMRAKQFVAIAENEIVVGISAGLFTMVLGAFVFGERLQRHGTLTLRRRTGALISQSQRTWRAIAMLDYADSWRRHYSWPAAYL